MAKKAKLNAYVDEELARQFKAVAQIYYGRIGLCLSAAMLRFIECDPKEQADLMKRVFDAEIAKEMGVAVDAAKAEQIRRITQREQRESKEKNGGI